MGIISGNCRQIGPIFHVKYVLHFWNLSIFTTISVLNFLKSLTFIQTFILKPKYYRDEEQLLCFFKVSNLSFLKKFSMDIVVKMARFHIIQSVLYVKYTLSNSGYYINGIRIIYRQSLCHAISSYICTVNTIGEI